MKIPADIKKKIGTQCGPQLLEYRIDPKSINLGFNLKSHIPHVAGQSSHGEYGVLKEIFRRLGVSAGTACEFGAWDGVYCSNAYDLVVSDGWSCIMMEADEDRYKKLLKTASRIPSIDPYHETIHFSHQQGKLLDAFFDEIKMPAVFDLLCIDIDSCDYQVWESLQKYAPKVVVIEADNLDLDIIQKEEIPHTHLGGSTCYPPMKRLGESKGYTLVEYTYNLIFVRNDLVAQVRP
tara:strand:+ start:8303 stop:9007 length:705 start_codon:yes stop_codon:yes gene_type:complete